MQLALPRGGEADARRFYEHLLGIPELPKPPHLAERGGCWFEQGDVKIHLGVDSDFRPALKAHPGLIVDDLPTMILKLRAAGATVRDDEPLVGYQRVYVDDPFGNRIELMEPNSTATVPDIGERSQRNSTGARVLIDGADVLQG